MPSSVRITRESIIEAGVSLVREEGYPAFSARNIARGLSCSTQPIFSNFSSMEELEQTVCEQVFKLYWERTQESMKRTDVPPYKASGLAYIDFAIDEPELFKLLFMRQRDDNTQAEEKPIDPIIDIIMQTVGIGREEALLFHAEMWIFVHGLASMAATGYLQWDRALIGSMLSDNYNGLVAVFTERSQKNVIDRDQITDQTV